MTDKVWDQKSATYLAVCTYMRHMYGLLAMIISCRYSVCNVDTLQFALLFLEKGEKSLFIIYVSSIHYFKIKLQLLMSLTQSKEDADSLKQVVSMMTFLQTKLQDFIQKAVPPIKIKSR